MDRKVILRLKLLNDITSIIEAIACGEINALHKARAIALIEHDDFLAKMSTALDMPYLMTAIHMLAGYNIDKLYRAHVLLQDEIKIEEG